MRIAAICAATVVGLAVMAGGTVVAQDAAPAASVPAADAGQVAYDAGKYKDALKIWTPRAEAGDAVAQAGLGLLYHNGEGVHKDYAKAFKWYQLAAEQGNAFAQWHLGGLYNRGEGVATDQATATL